MILRRKPLGTDTPATKSRSKLQKRHALRLELLEERRLLAVGPQLLGIDHNNGVLIQDGSIINTAPHELTFRFDEGQVLDRATLGAIRLIRSGDDGVFDNGNDVTINPGYLDLGQTSFSVVMRFSQTLVDDMYRVQIVGQGSGALRNTAGMAFGDSTADNIDNGQNFSQTFDLQLGAQVISVVPQPVTRDPGTGVLTQAKDKIEVYFNNDKLDAAKASTPAYYRLIDTQDQSLLFPQSVAYNSAANMATLTFPRDLSTATYQLQIGESEESNATASTAVDMGTISQQARAAVYDSPVRLDTDGNVVLTKIPDNGTVISAISVADSFLISDVNVELNVDHTWGPDLRIFLNGPGGQRVELVRDVGSQVRGGQIYGVKYDDLNGNGTRDTNEPGLPGWTIFIDSNANGELDPGERSTVTDAQGRYSFVNLDVGRSYQLVELPQTFWQSTEPVGGTSTAIFSTDFSNGSQQTLTIVGDATKGTFRLGLAGRITLPIDFAGPTQASITAVNIQKELTAILDPWVSVSVVAVNAKQYNVTFRVTGVGTLIDNPALVVVDNQLDIGQLQIMNVGDSSGFTSLGTNNTWHLSSGRGNTPGHTPEYSFYFGQNEKASGGGSYLNNADGTLRSPEIDLSDPAITGPITLRLNHLLSTEQGFDFAEIRAVVDGKTTVLLNTDVSTSGFEALQLDLTSFAGKKIQLEFNFKSDGSVTQEGWYVDDIRIELQRSARVVSLGSGPQQQVINDADFGSSRNAVVGPDAFGYQAFNVPNPTANFEDITTNPTAKRILQQFVDTGFALKIGGSADEVVNGMAQDAAGNTYLAGSFQGTVDFDPGAGSFPLTSAGANDIFVAKYDSSGALLWVRQAGGTGSDVATAVVIDNGGNAIVSGSFSQTASFGAANLISAGSTDAFVWKLNAAGTTQWAHGLGGTGLDEATGVAVTAGGDVVVTGAFTGTVDFDPGAPAQNQTSAGSTDAFVLRLTSDGDFVWVRRTGGTAADRGERVNITPEGNITTTGSFNGTVDFDPGSGTNNLTSAGNADGFVQQLTSAGNFRWAQAFGNSATSDRGNDVTSDALNNVLVTGVSNGDVFVRSISPTGTTNWTRTIGGVSTDVGEAIDVAADGTILVAGSFRSTVNFGSGDIVSVGGADAFVLTLTSTGNYAAVSTFGGPQDEFAFAVLNEDADSTLVAGTFRGTTAFDVGSSTVSLTSNGGSDMFLAKLAKKVGLDDGAVELTAADLNGFLFDFYGTAYNSLFVSSNGLISFGAANSSSANTNLLTAPSEPIIAAFWEDLRTGSADAEAVFWEVLGSGNAQRLVIQWNNVQVDNAKAAAIGPLDFQAILSERDGSIQLNYRTVADPQVIPVGTEQAVGSFTKGTQSGSHIAADAAGNYVVVWSSPNQDGSGNGVYARRFNAAGIPLGNEFLVNETTNLDQTSARVDMNASGRFVVVWQGNGPGDADGVFARVYNANGTPATDEFLVNHSTTGAQVNAWVGLDAAGNFVVVWNGQGVDDASGVSLRRFAADGQPLGEIDEIQRLRFLGPPAVGATFTLNHNGLQTAAIAYAANANVAATNIRNALRALNAGSTTDVVALPTSNEIQTITFTGTPASGTFTLDLDRVTTADITYAGVGNGLQTAVNIQNALLALGNIGAGNVSVAPVGASDTEFRVTFAGALTGTDMPLLSLDTNNLNQGALDVVETLAGSTFGIDFEVRFSGIDGGINQPLLSLANTQNGVTHIQFMTRRDGSNGELRVNNFLTSEQSFPRINVSPTGEFIVAWDSDTQDGSSFGSYAKRYDANGVAIAPEVDELQKLTLNAPSANAQFSLRVGAATTALINYAGLNSGSATAARIQIALANAGLAGVSVTAGFGTSDEVQQIDFTTGANNTPAAGTFQLAYRGLATAPIVFAGQLSADAQTTATNIETALRALIPTSTLTVVAAPAGGGNFNPYRYIVTFSGPVVGGIDQPQMVPIGNNLNQGSYSVSTTDDGGKSSNEFLVSFGGASGRKDQPAIQLVNNTLGVASITVEELIQGVNSEFLVNTEINDSQRNLGVVTRPDGSYFATWTSNGQDGDAQGIFGKLYDSSGNVLRDEFQINTFTQGDQTGPSVGSDAAGNLVVIWRSVGQDGDLGGIYARRLGADGFALGDEFLVNTLTAGNQNGHSLVVNPNGTFTVSWASEAGDGGIHAQRFAADGTKVGGEDQVSQFGLRSQDRPEIAQSLNGNYVLVWTDTARDSDNSSGIYGQLFDASGTALTAEFQVATTTAMVQSAASVDMDDAGNFVVVWATQELDADNKTITSLRGRRFDPAAVAQGDEFVIATNTTFSAVDVSVNRATGDFVATWLARPAGGATTIRAMLYDTNGVAQTGELDLVVSDDDNNPILQDVPRVAMDNSGAFGVTWSTWDFAQDLYQVMLGRWDATGTPTSASIVAGVRPASDTGFDYDIPDLAVDSNGVLSLVWQSFDFRGNFTYEDVLFRRFDTTLLSLGDAIRVNDDSSSDPLTGPFYPRIAHAPDDSFVVTWRDDRLSGVLAQRFDRTGTLIGSNAVVNNLTTSTQTLPVVVASNNGEFRVAFLDDRAGQGVFTRAFTSDLASVGIKDAGAQNAGENVLQIWVDGSRTTLVAPNTSTRIARLQQPQGRLFAVDATNNRLLELDSKTGATLKSYPLPAAAGADAGLAYAGGTVYYVPGNGSALYELHPNTGGTADVMPLSGISSGGLAGVAYLNGEVVLLDATAGQLIFIDPYRNHEVRRVTPSTALAGGLVGGGNRGTLFAINAASEIVELSPVDGSVLATIASPGGNLVGLAFVDGVMLASDNAGVVYRIDPTSGAVLGTLAVPAGLAGLGADGGGGVAAATGGNYQPFINTILDDEATTSITEGVGPYTGRYVPVQPLSAFDGTNVRGSWRLEIQDTSTGSVGVLNSWRLLINETQDTPPDASHVGFIGDSTDTATSAVNDVDLYRFNVLQGGTISVAVNPAAGLNVVIRLFDALGNSLTSVNAAGVGGAENLTYVAADAGVFFVGISSAGNAAYDIVTGSGATGGTSSGSYKLDIRFSEPVALDDDNSSFATATPIGVIGASGQIIRAEVRSGPYLPILPGGIDEPGHRDIPPETHLNATGGSSFVPNQIILRFEDGVSPQRRAELLAANGLEVIKSFDFIGALVVRTQAGTDVRAKTGQLNQLSEVRYADPDYLQTAELVPDDPRFPEQWGYDNLGQTGGTVDADIDLPEAWDTFTGSAQTVIAVIDSGVDYNHPDLIANLWINPGEIAGDGIDNDGNGYIDDIYGIDTINGDSDPLDDNGHGTHTAGTTSAVGNNGLGVTGVNWNAKIMALKFLDASGSGSTSAAIEAVNYLVTMKTIYGINIVVSNNSWGGGGFSQALMDAIDASINVGMPFVAAAGNFSTDNDVNPFYPASYPLDGIISVAATDHNDQLAGFSHFGLTSVDIAAPGVNILSTTLGGGYGLNSGTSMASPHVAGVVALMAGYNPQATVDQLKSAIMLGGDPLPNLTGTSVSGARLNAAQSLSLLGGGSGGPSGSAILTAFYNFQDNYGTLPSGATASNAITENQKQRTREILEIYSQQLGIQFIETANEGLTVATGDLRAIAPTVPGGPGGVAGISEGSLFGRVIMDAAENWGDSEYGGSWFQTAMHEIGHSLGLGHAYDLPNLTIMGGFGVGEPVFPGDADLVHGKYLHNPGSIDQDLYKFTLNEDGMFTAETIAERLAPNASLLDTVITIYREVGTGRRELVASNDDYFSNDSYLHLQLSRGTYYIDVSASGNSGMDPSISDTGFGGTSQGDYELALSFRPLVRSALLDAEGVALDGDADGAPGGTFSFFFESGPTIFVDKLADTTPAVDGNGSLASPFDNIYSATELARSTLVMPRDGAAGLRDGEAFVISDGLNPAVRFEFDDDGRVTAGSVAVPFTSTMNGQELATAVSNAILAIVNNTAGALNPIRLNVTPSVVSGMVRISGTALVDASESASLLRSPSIIRIVGNGGPDRDPTTLLDNRPYLVGVDGTRVLSDGKSVNVPQGVTVMVDAGALFKMREANFDVGTSARGVNRSHGALQILGTPSNQVSFYSYRNDTIGGDSDGPGTGPAPGDWGGLVFRSDSDSEQAGTFLNWVNNATIVGGGGKLLVESVEDTYTPIHLIDARPTISHNTIRRSADAAVSADPASFNDDDGRIGPDIHGNLIINNSINGLFVRIRTELGATIDKIVVPSRWDDTDIVHVLTENLLISATPGGPLKDAATGIIQARLDGSLKIDPGIIVKLQGARIETKVGAQLIAEGTAADPVIFTSLSDDTYGGSGSFDTKNDAGVTRPAAGQWGGLFFGATAQGSLDHVLLSYAGGLTPIEGGFDRFNAIEIHQADVRLTNSVIRDNAAGISSTDRSGRGGNAPATIFVLGAQPIIVNNLFQDNLGTVIHINANALQAVTHPDTGRTTGGIDRFDAFADNYGPLVRLNRLQNNSFNGMEVRGAVLTTETVWDDTDIAHILRGEISVLNHHTFSGLHLLSSQSQSLVVKLAGPNAGFNAHGTLLDIDDRIGGSIYIGASGLPVVLTSLADDSAIAGVDFFGQPLGDTDNNGLSTGAAGDWRGILLDSLSNDRNVSLTREIEPAFSGSLDINRVPADAQFLGNLAPDEKSGDVNRRLGFEVYGNISVDNSRDVDIYSFSGVAGTEVYFDIDQTGASLDSILELVDATGTVLARSIDSSINDLSGLALPLLKAAYLGHDYYSITDRDPGMRVVLPGAVGQTNTYFVRVRSNPTDPALDSTQPGNIEDINGGLSRGDYKLQIRLRQVDEKPGSFIRGADIRFATNGIQVLGLPNHSPLVGESYETRAGNESLGAAQTLGNLLTSDRNTISVGGNLSTSTDVDWYSFEIDYDLIQSIGGFNSGGKTFATVFDIDYADGLARADTVLSVFDAAGNLVLVSRDSNVEDDQPGVGQGADTDDLSRGSFGTQDAYIGSVQMPAGVPGSKTTYYVAVSSNSQLPTALNGTFTSGASNTLVRLEPVSSLQRIAEDHIGFQGYRSGSLSGSISVQPTTPLFDLSDSISLATNVVPFTLNDVVLYTAQPGTNGLKTVNPFTGTTWINDVGNLPTNGPNRTIGDLAMRSDGRLFAVESLAGAQNTAGRLVELDPATGAATVIGNDNIPDIVAATTPPNLEELTSPGIDAFAWQRTDVAAYDLYYSIQGGRRGAGVDTSSSTLYRADPASGSAAAVQGQPWGVRGEIYETARGDLGRTTGMAFVGGVLYGVSDQGFFYQINTATGQATNVVDLGGSFSALALGPQNVEDGRYANMLFASTGTGVINAIDVNGNLQAVFSTGTSVSTTTAPVGIAFSVLDFNLWHPTMQRRADAGHGINNTFDNSRPTSTTWLNGIGSNTDTRRSDENEGGASFYFGLETWQQDPNAADAYFRYGTNAQYGILNSNNHRDMSANSLLNNNYNLPGGAQGSLATNTVSLAGYAAADKPTIYFNYYLETEGQNTITTNQMRDSARVLVSRDGGASWELLATNNSVLSSTSAFGELPRFISPNVEASTHPRQQVQELFDNSGGWRQARIDLSNYAGEAQLQFRFDFTTAGAMIGPNGTSQSGDPSSFGNLSDKRHLLLNTSEGFYVDDVIIGFAERGEMVTNSGAQSSYFTIPQNPNPADPSQILTGLYQLEIRRGTEYGAVADDLNPDIAIYQTLGTNDRLVGSLFRLGDSNLHRDQGQVLIANNTISDSLQFGIVVDAAVRSEGGSLMHPGGVRNLPTINNARLTGGVKIENNIVANFGQGGIRFSGDPNSGTDPLASVPFGRIMNNTVYGGDTRTGVGIEISQNASPTVLNNIIANTVSGLSIDASSNSSVVGANLFQNNTNNGTIGQNAFVLLPTAPLFVNAAAGNFYPAAGSLSIDSSLNSLADRPNFVAVNSPLGIPPSPLLAPERDRYGQLRLDDPAQDPPPGLGSNIFKDRGAVERADFSGPTAKLLEPLDNDGLGTDLNPIPNEVLVAPANISQIVIQLLDQGIGIDDDTVTPATVQLRLDGVLLVAGTDYEFVYNATNNLIVLRALKNNGPVSNRYDVRLINDPATGIRDLASNPLSPNLPAGTTDFVVITNGQISNNSLPDFTIASPTVTALEDNERELGIATTEVANYAGNLPPLGGIGDPVLAFITVSNSRPGLFSVQPSIDRSGNLSFVTSADQVGSAVLVMRLTETGVSNPRQSSPQTFTITLTPVNDAPFLSVPTTLDVNEDQGLVQIPNFAVNLGPGPVTAVDEVGQSLTIVTTALDPSAFSVLPTIDSLGTLRFQTRPDYNSLIAPLLVTVQVTDDGSAVAPNVNSSTLATFTIAVAPVNDPPSFTWTGSSLSVPEDNEQYLGVPQSEFPGFVTNVAPGPVTAIDEASQTTTFLVTTDAPNLFSQQPAIDSSGTLTFRTASNRSGFATVFVQLQDSGPGTPSPNQNLSNRATFIITVTPVNDPPEFNLLPALTVEEDSGLRSIANFASNIRRGPQEAADESAQQITFDVVADDPAAFIIQPTIAVDGTLSFRTALNANSANANFGFSVRLRDDGLSSPPPNNNLSAAQSFVVNVTPVNDAPTTDAFTAIGTEDTSTTIQSADVLVGDKAGPTPDEFGQSLRITQVQATSLHGGTIVPVFDPLDATRIVSMNYSPPLNLTGDDTFLYVVSDDGSPERSGTGTITISITPVNDPPAFNRGPDQTLNEDAAPVSIPNWATGIVAGPASAADELASQTVSFTVVADNPAWFSVQPAVSDAGTLTYTLAKDINGSTNVVVTAVDSGPGTGANVNRSAPQTFAIHVTPVNDPPVFTAGPTVIVNEDSGAYSNPWATGIAAAAGLLTSPPTATDESSQIYNFELTVDRPQLFSVQPQISSAGVLEFTTAGDAFGQALVVATLVDLGPTGAPNTPRSAPATFTISITPSNDAPVANGDTYTTDEDSVLTVAAPGVLANDTDVDLPNDTLKVAAGTFTSDLGAKVTLNADGSLTYDPNGVATFQQLTQGQTISDTFVYHVLDAAGASSNNATVTIAIRGVNDAPVAVDDRYSIAVGQSRTLDILANDSDVDSTIDPRTIEITSRPGFGTLTVNQTGVVTYTPESGFRGNDVFRYTVKDSTGTISNEAQVVLIVNSAPVAANDSAFTVKGDPVTINVLANDRDIDGTLDTSSVRIEVSPAPNGSVEVLPTGAIRFTPTSGFAGEATFAYSVLDNAGTRSNVATVNIRVQNSRWQNPQNNLDVNADGFVSPIDALLVINYLNGHGNPILPDSGVVPPPYLDPTGDELVTPNDVLQIINYLNANSQGGRGEGESSGVEYAMPITPQQIIDSVGPSIEHERLAARSHILDEITATISPATVSQPTMSSFAVPTIAINSTSRRDDELLDLLSSSIHNADIDGSLSDPQADTIDTALDQLLKELSL